MSAEPVISFVIPTFNTGAALPALMAAFAELQMEEPWELILVDDGSEDGTALRVRESIPALPHLRLVELARNYGEHAAVLEGLRHVRGRVAVTMDDDLQNPLEEAVRLARLLLESESEVIFGRYECKQHSWPRNAGSRAVNALATVLLGKPRDLYLSSFRALKRELVDRLIAYRGPYPHVDGLILNATNRLSQVPVRHMPRACGGSGYTVRKLLRLALTLCFDFSVMPLRVAGVLGLLLCLGGAVLIAEVIVEYFIVGHVQPGWSSLMGAVAVFSGAQLVMLGVIGEYVGRTFLTVSGRPQSLVRAVHGREEKS